MSAKQFSKEIIQKANEAIKKFGKDQFDDKGPPEVMNLNPLIKQFKKLTQAEKVELANLLKTESEASAVLIGLIEDDESLSELQISELIKSGNDELLNYFRPRQPVPITITNLSSLDDLLKKK